MKAIIIIGMLVVMAVSVGAALPAGTSTYYGYDAQNNLIKITDAKGHESVNTYNSLGQIIRSTHPDTGTVSLAYDDAGNMLERNQNGRVTRYQYDTLNRLTKIDYPSSPDVINRYDQGCLNGNAYAIGKLCTVQDASGSMVFGYDNWGRMIKEVKTISNYLAGPKNYTIEAKYDIIGNVRQLMLNGEVIANYQYNQLNQLVAVTDKNGKQVAAYAYNPESTVKSLQFGNSIRTDYSYTIRDWLESVSSPVFQRSFAFDKVGNIIQLNQRGNALAAFQYDRLDRLTRVNDAGYYDKNMQFSYDAVGNRLRMNDARYEYTPANNQMVAAGSETFAYDPFGNLVRRNEFGYAYDDENRLIRAETTNGTNEYVYDANGLRAVKKDSQGVTVYIYDFGGNNIYEETDK
ncbi:RHS repeat protein [Candidatus Woesearchaeota archaeon]|nr:RHS repeat protein [Candidatus Woesearchaeota archaeon]